MNSEKVKLLIKLLVLELIGLLIIALAVLMVDYADTYPTKASVALSGYVVALIMLIAYFFPKGNFLFRFIIYNCEHMVGVWSKKGALLVSGVMFVIATYLLFYCRC